MFQAFEAVVPDATFNPKFRCPCCNHGFRLNDHGGLYDVTFMGIDDNFFVIHCEQCSGSMASNGPEREAVKRWFKDVIEKRTPDIGREYAITSEKIIAVNGGDIRAAIFNGWPFSISADQCHVAVLPGGLVLVTQKGDSHGA